MQIRRHLRFVPTDDSRLGYLPTDWNSFLVDVTPTPEVINSPTFLGHFCARNVQSRETAKRGLRRPFKEDADSSPGARAPRLPRTSRVGRAWNREPPTALPAVRGHSLDLSRALPWFPPSSFLLFLVANLFSNCFLLVCIPYPLGMQTSGSPVSILSRSIPSRSRLSGSLV